MNYSLFWTSLLGQADAVELLKSRGASVNVINDAPRALMTSELLSKVEATPVYLDLPVFLAFKSNANGSASTLGRNALSVLGGRELQFLL